MKKVGLEDSCELWYARLGLECERFTWIPLQNREERQKINSDPFL